MLCAALRVNQTVTSLDLRGCKVNKTAAEDLAQVLHVSPSLTDLYIDEADECSVALREEVNRQSFNFAAMQSRLLAAGAPEVAAVPAVAVAGKGGEGSNEKSPAQKRGVCDGGFVAPGLEAVFGGAAVAAVSAAANDDQQNASQGHIHGPEAGVNVADQGGAAVSEASRGAKVAQDGGTGLPMAIAPKWPRHVGCQTRMAWVDMEAERVAERERQRQAGAEARGMLQEAQDALRAMAVDRARLKADNQRLTKHMRVLEEEHAGWQAASTALMEQERAKLQLEADVKQKQAALDMEKQVSKANESEARAHIALEDLQRRLAAAEEEMVRREASARAAEAKSNEFLLQDLEKRVAAAVQMEANTKLAKDALQETVDVLRQKLSAQELEHKESERRWRDEVAAATRIGEQRRKEADLPERDLSLIHIQLSKKREEEEIRHDREDEWNAAEERELKREEGLQRTLQEASDARGMIVTGFSQNLHETLQTELQRDRDRAIEELQRERVDREAGQRSREVIVEGGQQGQEGEMQTGRDVETYSDVKVEPRLDRALAPSTTPPQNHDDASSDSKGGGDKGVREAGSMSKWLGSGEGIGANPRGSTGSGGNHEPLSGLSEAVEGLSKSTTQLFSGVWGGLGGMVGIGSSSEEKGLSAVRSRVATIEHVESSLDPRTREAVKVLILKGRTDQQVVKHYTIAESGITEQQVQTVRVQLALEQSSKHDPSHSGRQASPGIQLRSERPYCVVTIVPNSPAALSGKIRVGDILVSVQGQECDFKTPEEVQNLMRGPEGSIIGMRFIRNTGGAVDCSAEPAESESYPVTLRRALVPFIAAAGDGSERQDAGMGNETSMEASARESPALASHLPLGNPRDAHAGRREAEDGGDSGRGDAGQGVGAEWSAASRVSAQASKS